MLNIDSSLKFNNQGQTSLINHENHIRNMIENLLFTSPGERVNRPDFGSGLFQMVFEPNNTEVAGTLQFLLQAALNQWMGTLIELNKVEINALDANLEVTVVYTLSYNKDQQIATFLQPMP
ncbi:MAG: GPW/gp25 family protein [Saprospiraceae bacterium]|nr:GPW/gp25 family protein [Saprospiraceae bacterium]